MISDKKRSVRDGLSGVVAGLEMILGYFIVEYFVLQWGLGGALSEVPGNLVQIVVGASVGIPLGYVIRRRLPEILR